MDLSRITWRTASYSSSNGGNLRRSGRRPEHACRRPGLKRPRRPEAGHHPSEVAGVHVQGKEGDAGPGLSTRPATTYPGGRCHHGSVPPLTFTGQHPSHGPAAGGPAPQRPGTPVTGGLQDNASGGASGSGMEGKGSAAGRAAHRNRPGWKAGHPGAGIPGQAGRSRPGTRRPGIRIAPAPPRRSGPYR